MGVMKTLRFAVVLALGIAGLFAQEKAPEKMSAEDQYHLQALNAKIDNIQYQINELAKQLKAPEIVQEKNSLVAKVCAVAKIAAAECVPNPDTGEVTKKTPPSEPKKL